MKKFLSLALAAILTMTVAAPAMAQAPYFLNRAGAEAEYAVKDADGDISAYSKIVVTGLSSTDAENFTITYTAEAFNANHGSVAAPIESTVTVRNGAVITTPVMEGVEVEGTMPSLPANLSVGQEMDYSFSMKVMGINTSTEGKVSVVASESVTTPAGTFDCFKVETTANSKAMLQTIRTKTISWVTPGVGTVRIEVYDNRDRLQSSQELISVSR